MKFDDALTDDAVIGELGARLARTRLELDLSQRELEERSGVSRSAIQDAEKGEAITLITLIRLLRALGLLDGLDGLLPEPSISPIQQLKLQGRQRRRASGGARSDAEERPDPEPDGGRWTWGDERPSADDR